MRLDLKESRDFIFFPGEEGGGHSTQSNRKRKQLTDDPVRLPGVEGAGDGLHDGGEREEKQAPVGGIQKPAPHRPRVEHTSLERRVPDSPAGEGQGHCGPVQQVPALSPRPLDRETGREVNQ